MLRAFHRVFIFIGKNMYRMFESRTSSSMSRRALLVAGLAGAVFGSATSSVGSAQVVPSGTQFVIIISGFYSGQGTATVSGGNVQITGNVKNDQGLSGSFNVSCPLAGDHFRGTGGLTMGGDGGAGAAKSNNFIIQGRVEAKDPQQNPNAVVTDARIGATYVEVQNGNVIHGGRLSGATPPPATQPTGK
jgi:hypothetical protein